MRFLPDPLPTAGERTPGVTRPPPLQTGIGGQEQRWRGWEQNAGGLEVRHPPVKVRERCLHRWPQQSWPPLRERSLRPLEEASVEHGVWHRQSCKIQVAAQALKRFESPET